MLEQFAQSNNDESKLIYAAAAWRERQESEKNAPLRQNNLHSRKIIFYNQLELLPKTMRRERTG